MTPRERAMALWGPCTCGSREPDIDHPLDFHSYLCRRALGPSFEDVVKAIEDTAERCARVLEQEMTIQYVNVSDLIDHLAQMIREQEGAHGAQA